MRNLSKTLLKHPFFEKFIMIVILLNSILIGVETAYQNDIIHSFQYFALLVFVLEIAVRFSARESTRDYFTNAWNIFDITLVLIALIPPSIFPNATLLMSMRVLRVFRVLRLLKTSYEIRLIISVLVRSFSALTYNALFFIIFMYLFSIVGVTLFRLPEAQNSPPEMVPLIEQYYALAPNAPGNAPDPYGNLSEAWFSLFRILTGEDWTDLRYNLLVASDLGLLKTSKVVITGFHVIWYILSSFLLLNLLVGAILNNYQIIMDEERKKKAEKEKQRELLGKSGIQ
jgi:voltage-gated sodium channel